MEMILEMKGVKEEGVLIEEGALIEEGVLREEGQDPLEKEISLLID